MNKLNITLVALLGVALIGFLALYSAKPTQTVIEKTVGAVAGSDFTNRVSFLDGFEWGGKYATVATTSATYTLSANQYKSGLIEVTSVTGAAALTLSLPASTTDAYPRQVGMRTSTIIKNSHTAAATTTTIAAGTGIDLQENDGQNVVIGINNYAVVDCVRLVTTDVACIINETIPAD